MPLLQEIRPNQNFSDNLLDIFLRKVLRSLSRGGIILRTLAQSVLWHLLWFQSTLYLFLASPPGSILYILTIGSLSSGTELHWRYTGCGPRRMDCRRISVVCCPQGSARGVSRLELYELPEQPCDLHPSGASFRVMALCRRPIRAPIDLRFIIHLRAPKAMPDGGKKQDNPDLWIKQDIWRIRNELLSLCTRKFITINKNQTVSLKPTLNLQA